MPVELHRDAPVIVFGDGDIGVASYGEAGKSQGGLRLFLVDPARVGSDLPFDRVAELDPLVILHFMSPESLDVVLDGLKLIRDLMTGGSPGKDS